MTTSPFDRRATLRKAALLLAGLLLVSCAGQSGISSQPSEGEGEGEGEGKADVGASTEEDAGPTDAALPGDSSTPPDAQAPLDAATSDTSPDGSPDDTGPLADAADSDCSRDAQPTPDATSDAGLPHDAATSDGPDSDRAPDGCSRGGCPPDERCDTLLNACVAAQPCEATADCRDGTWCVAPGYCLTAPQPPCTEDRDCPAGWLCDRWRGGTCMHPAPCLEDDHCPAGLACDRDSGRCTGCSDAIPCPGRQRCLAGPPPLQSSCADAAVCLDDGDCPGERWCDEGTCAAAACLDDGHEPNDGPTQAAPLLPLAHTELVLCGGDTEDWYRVDVPAGDGLRVELHQLGGDKPLKLGLYHPGSLPTLIEEDTAGLQRSVVQWAGAVEQDRSVLIRTGSLTNRRQEYTLDVHLLPGGLCPGDAYDRAPGDPSPPPIGVGQQLDALLCPHTMDRFSFEGNEGEELLAHLEVSPDLLPLQVLIQGPQGSVLAAGEQVPGGWETRLTLPTTGDYQLLVSGEAPSQGTPYRLRVDVGAGPARLRCELADELQPGVAIACSPPVQDLFDSACSQAGAPEGVLRFRLDGPATVRIWAVAERVPAQEDAGLPEQGAGFDAGCGDAGAYSHEAPADQRADGGLAAGGDPPGPPARQDVVLSLRGPCGDAEPELACSDDGRLAVDLLPAGSYQVLAELLEVEPGGPAAPILLQLELDPPPPPPPNDLCAQATQLLPGEPTRGSTWAASDDSPDRCGTLPPGTREVYHRFRLLETNRVELDLQAVAPLTSRILRHCDGPAVHCGTGEAVLRPGDYVVAVSEQEPDRHGAYTLTLNLGPAPPPPPHSSCHEAAELQPGVPLRGETRLARNDHTSACGGGGPDLFYRIRAPELPAAEAEQQEQGQREAQEQPPPQLVLVRMQADFPATLAAYNRCEGEPLFCWSVGQGLLTRVEMSNDELLLAVDGAGAYDWGSFTLLASFPSPPPGNDCTQPIPLAPGDEIYGDTTAASNDIDPRKLACMNGHPMPGPDVFFEVQLEARELLEVSLSTPGWDGALYLVSECSGTCLAGSDRALQGGIEQLSWTPGRGGSYILVVDGFGGFGPFTLRRR